MIVYGLSGMWQNWFIATISGADFEQRLNDVNFYTLGVSRSWLHIKITNIEKMNQDAEKHVCFYVEPQNLPWYLCAYFEKTNDIRMDITDFHQSLLSKRMTDPTFARFMSFIKENYSITETSSKEHIHNSLIESFYHLFIAPLPHDWKTPVYAMSNIGLNIELSDFYDGDHLYNKIADYTGVTRERFDYMYALLEKHNARYFNLKSDFVLKVLSKQFDQLNVIELGWLGALRYHTDGVRLDWYNPVVRQEAFNKMR